MKQMYKVLIVEKQNSIKSTVSGGGFVSPETRVEWTSARVFVGTRKRTN
jgi:hypothetical protein